MYSVALGVVLAAVSRYFSGSEGVRLFLSLGSSSVDFLVSFANLSLGSPVRIFVIFSSLVALDESVVGASQGLGSDAVILVGMGRAPVGTSVLCFVDSEWKAELELEPDAPVEDVPVLGSLVETELDLAAVVALVAGFLGGGLLS